MTETRIAQINTNFQRVPVPAAQIAPLKDVEGQADPPMVHNRSHKLYCRPWLLIGAKGEGSTSLYYTKEARFEKCPSGAQIFFGWLVSRYPTATSDAK